MKKVLLTTAVFGVACGVFAQGEVSFVNNSSSSTKISVNSAAGGAATALTGTTAGAYYFEFLYSLAGATSVNLPGGATSASIIPPSTAVTSLTADFVTGQATPDFTDSTLIAANTGTVGRVAGTSSAVINAFSPGAAYTGVVIGWSANIGSTYSALVSFLAAPTTDVNGTPAYVGESPVGTFTAGGGSTPVPNVLAPSPGITGFTLGEVGPIIPTPEPSTIALGVMGGLSLLALRRKKA